MRCLGILLIACAVRGAERDGNRFTIVDRDGGISIEFASPVSFQFERWWGSKHASGAPLSLASLTIKQSDLADGILLSSRFLELTLAKGMLTVKTTSGREVAVMPRPASREGFTFKTYPDEMFYGLGATAAPKLNLRGSVVKSTKPLLISSHGYGLFVPTGPATFDLSQPDHIAIGTATFQFYYGPNPKEILEQHALTTHNQIDLEEATLSARDERRLPKEVHRLDISDANYCDSPRLLNQLSLSGELFPALDLAKLSKHDPLIRLLPFLYDSKGASHPELEQRRSPWELYLVAYLREAHDRALPFIRPLLMQFPQDKGLGARSDVYMIGDEILVAPGCNVTEVELPRGSWTDLRTNTRHPGRQKIPNDPKAGLPIFAKAGSLIPLTTPRRLELHYFPTLGGEFFVYEPSVNEYSQFHAAPSADFMRVESESKVTRTCEWILHHTSNPKSVGETGKLYKEATSRVALQAGTWFHDPATGNLHIVVATAAGEDHIVNMSF